MRECSNYLLTANIPENIFSKTICICKSYTKMELHCYWYNPSGHHNRLSAQSLRAQTAKAGAHLDVMLQHNAIALFIMQGQLDSCQW